MMEARKVRDGREQDWFVVAANRDGARWLVLYHGVKHTAGALYRIGLALLISKSPTFAHCGEILGSSVRDRL
jgi:hypothetical protein